MHQPLQLNKCAKLSIQLPKKPPKCVKIQFNRQQKCKNAPKIRISCGSIKMRQHSPLRTRPWCWRSSPARCARPWGCSCRARATASTSGSCRPSGPPSRKEGDLGVNGVPGRKKTHDIYRTSLAVNLSQESLDLERDSVQYPYNI